MGWGTSGKLSPSCSYNEKLGSDRVGSVIYYGMGWLFSKERTEFRRSFTD
jgi:hypothetical protein